MTYYYSYRMNQMREEIWSYDSLLFLQNESNERRDLELWLIPTEWIKWEKRSLTYRMNQMREEIWSYDRNESNTGVMTYYYSYRNESNERRDLELWLTTIPTEESNESVNEKNQMREEIWSYDLLREEIYYLQNESNERRDLELWLTTIHTEWIKWEKRSGVMTYYYSYRMN